LNSRSDVILPHKKFTWADFGGIYPDIPPVDTPLATHAISAKRSPNIGLQVYWIFQSLASGFPA